MKFHIGYQNNIRLTERILAGRAQVAEVYFPWPGFTTGRGELLRQEDADALRRDLPRFREAGIALNWLLNGNCYGARTLARTLYQNLGDTMDYLRNEFHVSGITTASPVIAKFIRTNFPEIKIRASVNMEIGTPEGAEYLLELFDAFHLKREFNHDAAALRRFSRFCRAHEKKLYLLANSGCLNFCSARTFHDNLVAHQSESAEMDNSFHFKGLCSEFLSTPAHREKLLAHSNFIRPEDVPLYEEFCDGMKLATRTNFNPVAVVEAYLSGLRHGNLFDLTEPAHASQFYPEILAGDRFPADYAATRMNCSKQCETCGYCDRIQKQATIKLDY